MRTPHVRFGAVGAVLLVAGVGSPVLAQEPTDPPAEEAADGASDEQPPAADEAPAGDDSAADEGAEGPDAPDAPEVAVSVEEGVVLDLTVAYEVEVAVVITLSNPTEETLHEVAVTVDGASLVSEVPSELGPGEMVDLEATAIVAHGAAPDGLVTVSAVLTGLIADSQDVTASGADSSVLVEISATVIERGDPATDDTDPVVLGEVIEAPAQPVVAEPEPPAEPAAPQLPATGAEPLGLLFVAGLAGSGGFAILRSGRRRGGPA